MPAIADHVNHNVAAEFVTELQRDPRHANDCIHVFSVDVENRNTLAPRQLSSKARRMQLLRDRGESDQVVDDDVQRTADAVGWNVSKIERLSENPLPGECAIPMYQQR